MFKKAISFSLSVFVAFIFVLSSPASAFISSAASVQAWPGETHQVLDQCRLNMGKGRPGRALLMGKPADSQSLYRLDLALVIESPGQSDVHIKLPPDFNGGYECSLAAGDFTGDRRDDIVVAMPTGGSGGVINYLIYTQKQGQWRLIYSPIYPGEIKMTGKYVDGYKARLCFQGIKKPVTIDLSSRRQSYDEAGIYKAGKLQEEVIPWLNADIMEITDYNHDGIKEVRAHYTVNGTCNADDIASVWAIWKYNNGRWTRHGLTVNRIN